MMYSLKSYTVGYASPICSKNKKSALQGRSNKRYEVMNNRKQAGINASFVELLYYGKG